MGTRLLADRAQPCNSGRAKGGGMVQERARVRLIGLPTDSHSSFLRGAAAAPPAIRAALHSDHSNMATESGLEVGRDLLLEDVGDLPLTETADDFNRIRAAAAAAAAEGTIPIFLG